MNYKALAMDIDGTLYNLRKTITPLTKRAIFKAREFGITIAIASGRPLRGIQEAAEQLKLAEKGGYILAYNGGKIVDARTNEVISRSFIPGEYIPAIAALAKKYGAPVVGHTAEALVTEYPDDEIIKLEADLNGMPVERIPSLSEYKASRLFKCIITGSDEKLFDLEKIFAKEFFGKLSVYRSEPYFLEVLPLGIDKANGIALLAEHLGISVKEFIACGDGFNDLSMIKAAGLGIAMANAQKLVKKAADRVTLSCDNDGLVPVIEKYLLKV